MFQDRVDAGEQLVERLKHEPVIRAAQPGEMVVLSIPRGGVVVGREVAAELGSRHEMIIVKKLGAPGQAELAIGAMAEDGNGTVVLNEGLIRVLEVSADYVEEEKQRVRAKIAHYRDLFRGGRDLDIRGRLFIIVDDGMATGETVKASVSWLRSKFKAQMSKVLVAVPVCSHHAAGELRAMGVSVVCLEERDDFSAIGEFYRDFAQVSDEDVVGLLGEN